MSILLVHNNDARRDAGAVKKIRRQSDDAFDITLADQRAANVGLSVAPEQNAVR